MDIIIENVKYLGEGQSPNGLFLPSYCHLHQEIHSELECASFQDAISNVLAQMDQPTKIDRNSGTSSNFDGVENTDMERDFKDVEIYGVSKILKVVENCGDGDNYKVAETFESISSHEEDINASYSDANSPTNNQEILSLKQDMSLDDVEK